VSPQALLELAIARTEAVNPQLNAVVPKHYDLGQDAIRAGLPDGPFRGVPFLLKDLGIALKGPNHQADITVVT
jgi:amidase